MDVINGYKWELYNVSGDLSEAIDVADKYPGRLHEMQLRLPWEVTSSCLYENSEGAVFHSRLKRWKSILQSELEHLGQKPWQINRRGDETAEVRK